uniref:Major ampullate gland peroxidase n=1 Tax=Trichonephila senegalensis TaxID=156852 RepID=Q869B5_9ARAC|nr:major ampullate gland peroxidase [Trichonephila senegalensis]
MIFCSSILVLIIGLYLPLSYVIGDDSSKTQCEEGPVFCGRTSSKSRQDEYNCGTSTDEIADDPNKCHDDDVVQCDPEYPYRTFKGTCNNLNYPLWGRANECYSRILPAFYDGFEGERKSTQGGPLPQPRDITLNIVSKIQRPAPKVTYMFSVYGQTVAHDCSMAPEEQVSVSCCGPESKNDPSCISIAVRPDDPFFSKFNVTCLELIRTQKCNSCNTEKREQINRSTASLDASIVYGTNDDRANSLRTLDGTGKMIVSRTENGNLLPVNTSDTTDIFCTEEEKSKSKCFYSGDARVNQHVLLTSMQTVFVREHNRIASVLKTLNPQWEEQKLYQEARRINIAQIQCINYKEYLPVLLGSDLMHKYSLKVLNGPAGTKYDPNIRLSTWNVFAAAIFRIHSMVASNVGVPHLKFRDYYSNPDLIWNGTMNGMVQGVCKVASAMYDNRYTVDTLDYLYKAPNADFGSDLSSVDMRRGRDHGLPPYVHLVNYCSDGNIKISSFKDLSPRLMSKKNARLLEENYASVEDVDLQTGAQLEDHFPGSLVGPTAACILAKQFRVFKFGDRLYFEHEGEVPSFTPEQGESLKLTSLSRLLCDNLNISRIQRNTMLRAGRENPKVSCDELPRMDLTLWKEAYLE